MEPNLHGAASNRVHGSRYGMQRGLCFAVIPDETVNRKELVEFIEGKITGFFYNIPVLLQNSMRTEIGAIPATMAASASQSLHPRTAKNLSPCNPADTVSIRMEEPGRLTTLRCSDRASPSVPVGSLPVADEERT